MVSGSKDDLKYVSPRSGCAVSGKSGIGWEKKLLILPAFLNHITSMKVLSKADLENGFKLTEYFIKKNLQPIKKVKLDPFFRSRSSVFSLVLS